MTKFMRQLWKDEDGATMVEYGLMVALIAVVCVGTITTLGADLKIKFDAIVAAL